MSNLETKTLKQILDESGISYHFQGWAGNSQLILSQKYVADVIAQKEIATAKDEAEMWKKNRNIYVEKKNVLYQENQDLKAKFEAVNKILYDAIKEAEANISQWEKGSVARERMETETQIDLLYKLRDCLSQDLGVKRE